MSEFKVGDRVRLISCRRYGTIVKEKEMFETILNYTVLFDYEETDCLVSEECLEIVDEDGKTLLEQRIEKLEKYVMGEQNSLEKSENLSTMSKNGLLTEDERVILRSIPKKYNWIVRDKDWDLYVFEERPYQDEKDYFYWKSSNVVDGDYFGLFFNSMFMGIKKDTLYNIEELLKGECGNE